MSKVLLFNPRSAIAKHRIPNSIMNIAASVDGRYEWVIVDGNCESDPYNRIKDYLLTGGIRLCGNDSYAWPPNPAGYSLLQKTQKRVSFR